MLAKNNKVMNVQKRINAFLVNYFPIEANKQKSFIFVLVMSSYRVGGSGAVLLKLRQNRTNSITTPI